MKRFFVTLLLGAGAMLAHADGADTLREFVRDVKSGQAAFTQTVTSPDGSKTKVSSGEFAFTRPDRFRFTYTKPFQQTIVGDGTKVWIHDAELNQVSARKMASAIGATPAALLAGGGLDRDFDVSPLPAQGGLEWAQAVPKAKDGPFQSMRIGFRGKELAAVEIVDAFGQKSSLAFTGWKPNAALAPETFRFTVPPGADVIEQ